MIEILEKDVQGARHASSINEPHSHEEDIKSFIATPRMDQGIFGKLMTWWKAELKPGVHIVRKEGLRHMFIITSNSYEDRDGETITSDALKSYEDSCYPGDDLFHCDNPLLWWHDDDVVIGEPVAVNYSEPFLVEVFRELPTPVSKILFDYAETNGDNAGASHRFGYLEKDRDPDGTFHRIFKQETSYLPERSLAANDRTYAGVIAPMASVQSDKRLDEIFEQVAGVKNAASKLHAKTGELDKELAALGLTHKAAKPPIPPLPPKADTSPVMDETIVEDETVEEDAKDTPSGMTTNRLLVILEGISDMLMQLQDADMGSLERDRAMLKEWTEFKEFHVSEKAAGETREKTLEERVKALETELAEARKRLSLAPRSASRELGTLDPELAKIEVADAIDGAEKAKKEEDFIDGGALWGKLMPLPK